MTDALIIAKPDPREKRLRSPARQVRMKEKLRRMPDGTFTFAAHLEGITKKIQQERLVDRYLALSEPRPLVYELALEGVFLVRFQRAIEQ